MSKPLDLNGWTVKTCCLSGTKGVSPFLVHSETGYEIQIHGNRDLIPFGFSVGGCESGIVGNNRTDNIEEQKAAAVRIISEHLFSSSQQVDYHTIRDYLNNKYKAKSKVEKDAISRVLSIMNDDYQKLWKLRVARNIDDMIGLRLR